LWHFISLSLDGNDPRRIERNFLTRAHLHDFTSPRHGWPLSYDQAVRTGYRILKIMDEHLADREWLALKHATIADLACYPYVALAAEGGVDTSSFGHVCRWLERVEEIPGFWPMPLIPNLPPVPLVPVPVA